MPRKTDPIDAAAVAMVAQHHRRLHPVRAEDNSLVLRLLSERRDDLAGERTRTANRLHALLRDLIPGGAKRNLSADQAAALRSCQRQSPGWSSSSYWQPTPRPGRLGTRRLDQRRHPVGCQKSGLGR